MTHGIRAMSVAALWRALGEASKAEKDGEAKCPAVVAMVTRELKRRGEFPEAKAAA